MNAMKRLTVFAVLVCLLLCGCGNTAADPTEPVMQILPATVPATVPVTVPVAESAPATQAPTETDTEPVPSEAAKVTVYLLTKVILFDNGSTEYHYDENYNIDSYTVLTLENTTMCETFFENKDPNGMACTVRTNWPGDAEGEIRSLTYSEDGKLLEEQTPVSIYSGYQYAYDPLGNRTEKREYYEGMLETAVYYEYDGNQLMAVHGTDNAGNWMFECHITDGLVIEKVFFDSEPNYGYLYEYDENRNLIQTFFYFGDEITPGEQYFYQAVEVDAERAGYLLEQQKYLIPIA